MNDIIYLVRPRNDLDRAIAAEEAEEICRYGTTLHTFVACKTGACCEKERQEHERLEAKR